MEYQARVFIDVWRPTLLRLVMCTLPQVEYLHFNMQFFVEFSTHHGHSVGFTILDNPQETMYIYIYLYSIWISQACYK